MGIFIHLVAGFGLMALLNWVGLIPWRKAVSAHWAERARVLFPAWVAAKFVYLAVVAMEKLILAGKMPFFH